MREVHGARRDAKGGGGDSGGEEPEDYVDAFGTLTAREDGTATFYGRRAGSESFSWASPPSRALYWLARGDAQPRDAARAACDMPPPRTRTRAHCASYTSHGRRGSLAWCGDARAARGRGAGGGVSRGERASRDASPPPAGSTHDLALLFVILHFGALGNAGFNPAFHSIGAVVYSYSSEVAPELWLLIAEQLLDFRDLDKDTVDCLQYLGSVFLKLFQPLLYIHVNLTTGNRALQFFQTVLSKPHLASRVLSIQFTLDLHPPPPFWTGFQALLPTLHNLQSLAFSFGEDDEDALNRIIGDGHLATSIPSNVHTLHLKFLYKRREFADKSGLWNFSHWRLSVSQIPAPIQNFVVSTPTYVIWPPTASQRSSVLLAWTSQMSMARRSATPSTLRCIVINSGFGDEYRLGEYINEWEESLAMGEEVEDEDWLAPELGGGDDMEGYVGTRIIWESANGRQWTVSDPYRAPKGISYAFGLENDEWKQTWLLRRLSPTSLFPRRWVPGPLMRDVEQQRQRDEDDDEDQRRENDEEELNLCQ
ncbi:hypothetical protein C8J57DRAFT_1507213 [Mycena rebaudengoi]|nr:hypothetical protein C8J57DRAFT_1507213 [Mycena rebaudengoi]